MKLWKTIKYIYVLTFLSGPLGNTQSYQCCFPMNCNLVKQIRNRVCKNIFVFPKYTIMI